LAFHLTRWPPEDLRFPVHPQVILVKDPMPDLMSRRVALNRRASLRGDKDTAVPMGDNGTQQVVQLDDVQGETELIYGREWINDGALVDRQGVECLSRRDEGVGAG
jgi:hypothetical protein